MNNPSSQQQPEALKQILLCSLIIKNNSKQQWIVLPAYKQQGKNWMAMLLWFSNLQPTDKNVSYLLSVQLWHKQPTSTTSRILPPSLQQICNRWWWTASTTNRIPTSNLNGISATDHDSTNRIPPDNWESATNDDDCPTCISAQSTVFLQLQTAFLITTSQLYF